MDKTFWNRINEALELIDLGDWISEYADTKDNGIGEVQVHTCPECLNDKYKLYVNTYINRWICYVCDYGRGQSDPTKLMAALSGRSLTSIRSELLELVPPAPAGDITDDLLQAFSGTQKQDVFDAPTIQLPGSPFEGKSLTERPVLQYAYNRGLTPSDVQTLGLRYVHKLPVKKGTKFIDGPFLVFPITIGGRPVCYQGRRMGDGVPKYVSGSDISNWLWPLDQTLFNVYKSKQLMLVEGVFDALGLIKMGHPAVCTFGKSLSDSQLDLLTELKPAELVFAWDLDAKQEVLRSVDRAAHKFTKTSVVSFDGYGGQSQKVDPGDALVDPMVAQWIQGRLAAAVDVRSQDFFQWRLS